MREWSCGKFMHALYIFIYRTMDATTPRERLPNRTFAGGPGSLHHLALTLRPLGGSSSLRPLRVHRDRAPLAGERWDLCTTTVRAQRQAASSRDRHMRVLYSIHTYALGTGQGSCIAYILTLQGRAKVGNGCAHRRGLPGDGCVRGRPWAPAP